MSVTGPGAAGTPHPRTHELSATKEFALYFISFDLLEEEEKDIVIPLIL